MITINDLSSKFVQKVLNHYEIYTDNNISKFNLFVLFKQLFSIHYNIFTIEELICMSKLVGNIDITNNKKLLGKYISEQIVITNEDMIHNQLSDILPFEIANIINQYDVNKRAIYSTIFDKIKKVSDSAEYKYKYTTQGIPYVYRVGYDDWISQRNPNNKYWEIKNTDIIIPKFIDKLIELTNIDILPLFITPFSSFESKFLGINLDYFKLKPKFIYKTEKLTKGKRITYPYKKMKLIIKPESFANIKGFDFDMNQVVLKLYIYQHRQQTVLRLEVIHYVNKYNNKIQTMDNLHNGMYQTTDYRENYFFELI
jgi:hypothetical protein